MLRKLALAVLFVILGAVTAFAADLTGKWTATVETPRGTQDLTFDFHVDGATLTGKVTSPRGESDITDGKIDGANVSFAVKVEANGQTRVTTYSGTLSGDELKLKQTRQGRNGEQTADITAKRATT